MGNFQSTDPDQPESTAEMINRHATNLNTGLNAATGVLQTTGVLANQIGNTANTVRASHASVTGNAVRTTHATVTGGDAFSMSKRMRSSVKHGGCDCTGGIYGGVEDSEARVGDLHEYEKSLSEGAKEDVIRRVARGMKRAGISVDPEAPLDEVTAQLVKEIPNPRHGKSFVGDAKSQEKVCRIVADVLNDEFTPGVTNDADKFIDTSFSATEICRKVSEWSHSFASGVNTEFLAVHASVRNALRNLVVVGEVMEKAFGLVADAIGEAKDDELARKAMRPAAIRRDAELNPPDAGATRALCEFHTHPCRLRFSRVSKNFASATPYD